MIEFRKQHFKFYRIFDKNEFPQSAYYHPFVVPYRIKHLKFAKSLSSYHYDLLYIMYGNEI